MCSTIWRHVASSSTQSTLESWRQSGVPSESTPISWSTSHNAAASDALLTGLSIHPVTPSSSALSRAPWPSAVTIKNGISLRFGSSLSRTWRRSSIPSIPGMFLSEKMASTSAVARMLRHSSPDRAVSGSQPRSVSSVLITSRFGA
jgi:hypothetical protein